MYIGSIKTNAPEFYLANTSTPHAPEVDSNGYVWRWGNLFDCAIDIKYSFDNFCYIGSVDLGLSGTNEVSVIVDGVKVAVRDTSKPVHVNLCGKELIIRAKGNFTDLHFKGAEIFGFYPDDDEPFILPRPKKLEYSGERVKIGSLSASTVDGMYAADFLTDSLTERYEALPDGDGIELHFKIGRAHV